MLILLLATAAATRHTAFSLHHSRAPPKREDLFIIIGDSKVNVTAYASEHPGGAEILRRFNGKNATRAFEATRHSPQAYELLRELSDGSAVNGRGAPTIKKLFTLEDRSNSHKLLGIFCLAHFVWRYWLVLFTNDSTASFANAGAFGMAALAAHTALSLSSFKFDVPKERVKRKPMIWQEYRAHNSIFATRSFACCAVATAAQQSAGRIGHQMAVVLSSGIVLASIAGADLATARLRENATESTTATMPYWDDVLPATERRFKHFYAYCQFLATLGCLAVTNPCWPFLIALPIQLASFLMTLVRKSILSTRGYHFTYTAALLFPFLVGIRNAAYHGTNPEFILIPPLGALLLLIRRSGVHKYVLWTVVVALRIQYATLFP